MMNKEVEKRLPYIAVINRETKEVIAHIDLNDSNYIVSSEFEVEIEFGKPAFIDIDGKIFMKVDEL